MLNWCMLGFCLCCCVWTGLQAQPLPWSPQSKETLAEGIAPPKGYERIPLSKGSFGDWLRALPLMPKGSAVMLFNGQVKPYQAGAERVLDIDIGKSDLQQCADAIMRLRAEYLYARNPQNEAIAFNFTSGHRIDWLRWAKHHRPKIEGKQVSYPQTKTGSPDWSYGNFRKYLNSIFMYAGTASLEKELPRTTLAELKVGDIFIQGGFPGHAVIILDIAKDSKTGKRCFLLGQSYMPAQSIHVLKNLENPSFSPWYPEDFGPQLSTPEWLFKAGAGALRTWP